MNTILKTILLKPELKSGVIVAPCLSGKTHALCAKAIQLASEGQQVLLVVPTISSAKAEGGVAYELAKQLIDSNHPYRISPESLNISIGGGKIKVCDLTFTPDKVFDTAIIMDSIKNPHLVGRRSPRFSSNTISVVSAYHIAENLTEYMLRGCLAVKYTIGGDINSITISTAHASKIESEDTVDCYLNSYGYFNMTIKQPDLLLVENNPNYMYYIQQSGEETRLRMLESNILKCYNYLQGKSS